MSVNSLINFGVPGQNGDRAAVLQPKLSNRFRVVFYNFGNPGETAPYDMTRACRSVTRPKPKFNSETLYSYISTVYIATRAEWQSISLKVFDDIDNSTSRRIQQQLSKQQNFFDQTASRAGENYKFELDVDVLAGGASATGNAVDPNVVEKWSIVGAYLEDVDLGELSYENSKAMEISMTIKFDNATIFDHNGQRMGTFSHTPEIDGRIGDITTGIVGG